MNLQRIPQLPLPWSPSMVMVSMVIISMARDGMSLAGLPPPSNCTRACGAIQVPYPFGLDDGSEDCYLSLNQSLTCNHSYSRPKLFSGDFEVTDIMLSSGELRVLANISYDCYNSTDPYQGTSRTWSNSLFATNALSQTRNVFTAIGCDTAAKFAIGNNNYGGCMSGCNGMSSVVDDQCVGIGCCTSSIPHRIYGYYTDFTLRPNNSQVYKFNNCSYSFVVEKDIYTFNKSDLTYMDPLRSFPMILDWYIGTQSCNEAMSDENTYACLSQNSECFNSTNGPGYICNCSQGYHGNPYLLKGCQDIDECESDRKEYPCHGICVNTKGGYNCTCPAGLFSTDPKNEPCVRKEVTPQTKFLLSLMLAIGLLLPLIMVLLCCVGYQRRKNKMLRKKFFKKNGGVFLEQALANHHMNTFKIFTVDELKKATKNFDKDCIVGRGGFGEVYKGMLENKIPIAVKRSMAVDEENGKEFANEVMILSNVNHKNIVKLLGCCLESDVPILVYEYISRGTLFNHLRTKSHQPLIPFRERLRIAIETARAICYLHLDASPPILHGDIKSSNILLNEWLTVKVSDFGTSILAPKDMSQFQTLVKGTYGYLDPEYFVTGYLTDKSDVFSFGVVLMELLTGKSPSTFGGKTEEISLSNKFLSCASENKLEEVLDPEIISEDLCDQVTMVAEISIRCLNMRGKDRPSIREVMMNLEEVMLRDTHPREKLHDDPKEAQSSLSMNIKLQ